MAAGKSTLAKQLSEEHNALLIREDKWLAELYPNEITNIRSYLTYSSRLKELVTPHIQQLLALNVSIILDFPANTVQQRGWFKSLYDPLEIDHILHYVEASDELCKRQLRQRSKNKPAGTAFTTDVEFDEITKYFQAPTIDEGFNLQKYPLP